MATPAPESNQLPPSSIEQHFKATYRFRARSLPSSGLCALELSHKPNVILFIRLHPLLPSLHHFPLCESSKPNRLRNDPLPSLAYHRKDQYCFIDRMANWEDKLDVIPPTYRRRTDPNLIVERRSFMGP
ncbi:hypothetical protein L218DRAFT_1032934 [Marasmius fiardii PR-910]|nr:hypothetical protein L218DRAFT_1032934 [Marasmius fiardii PR-910]